MVSHQKCHLFASAHEAIPLSEQVGYVWGFANQYVILHL